MFHTILLSLPCSLVTLWAFHRIPPAWLCDYGEIPEVCPKPSGIPPWLQLLLIFSFTLVSLWRLLPVMEKGVLSPAAVFLIPLLAHIGLADLSFQIIPDQHVAVILLAGLFTETSSGLPFKLAGLIAGVLPFLLILLPGLLRNQEWIGLGDIKLMGALGFFLGCRGILSVYVLSSLLSGLAILCLLGFRLLTGKKQLPAFLPLAPSIILAFVLWGSYPQLWW